VGQVTLDVWAGGHVFLAPSVDDTIRWWINKRVYTIKPANTGRTMTLQAANEYPGLPWGPMALIVINPKDSGFAFTLRDQSPQTFSFTVNIGRAVWLSRIKNGSGSPVWWPWLRTIK